MKKFLSFLAIAAMTAAVCVSCGDKNGGEDPEPEVKVRINTYSVLGDGWADVYVFTWNADGKVSNVNRSNGDKVWDFVYSGNTATVTGPDGDFVLTLNANGYCTSMTDPWGDVRTYTYNADGQLTEVKKGADVKSTLTYEEGCLLTWTRTKDGALQTKTHTYSSKKNVAGIFNIIQEATDPANQWWYLTGLFGKPSKNLCDSSKWNHSDAAATYTYDFDENGCVTAEHKDYPDWPEEFTYTWDVVK
ncbi:MAG: DUF4595 domain-containing protein [Tidjanibacter sp.]|nr:DUF4595 domain-containing protein [Tidjanibacter sp.]